MFLEKNYHFHPDLIDFEFKEGGFWIFAWKIKITIMKLENKNKNKRLILML